MALVIEENRGNDDSCLISDSVTIKNSLLQQKEKEWELVKRPRAGQAIILIPKYPLCGTNQTSQPTRAEIKTIKTIIWLCSFFFYTSCTVILQKFKTVDDLSVVIDTLVKPRAELE